MAGLISLGVQVAGGITQYLDAIHERKNDITSATTQVHRMRDLLKLVHDVAAKIEPTHAATAAFLNACASVEPELKALGEFSLKLAATKMPSQSHDVPGIISRQVEKLKYPFHRLAMDRLQSQLIRVNEMLQAALQISTL